MAKRLYAVEQIKLNRKILFNYNFAIFTIVNKSEIYKDTYQAYRHLPTKFNSHYTP